MKKYIYTETQVTQMHRLLNNITIKGIENAEYLAVVSQTLKSGVMIEEQEGDGSDDSN